MSSPRRSQALVAVMVLLSLALAGPGRPQTTTNEPALPARVYVPYEKLKNVLDTEGQGVFLPYKEFERLWLNAQGRPAAATAAPLPYLMSVARFRGKVDGKLAALALELTLDILGDEWTDVPLALGRVAVTNATFVEAPDAKAKPLLRLIDGQHHLLAKGKGRWVLGLDFVCQLKTEGELNVLQYELPAAAITTLELLIPEENMKVDVEPLLAAGSQPVGDREKGTQLQAFLGAAPQVKLSWKPKSEAAAELTPVIVCDQFHHLAVEEALLTQTITFNYDIRRRGVERFTIHVPASADAATAYRVTGVEGANLSKWNLDTQTVNNVVTQVVTVELFAAVQGAYTLTLRLERFLKDRDATAVLAPVVTQEALRQTGLIAITHSPRRSVEVRHANQGLVRVDVGRLPEALQKQPGVTAYRYTAADYRAELAIGTVLPRLTITQSWTLGVDRDVQHLAGRLDCQVERAGVFALTLRWPEPWELLDAGPADLVDDREVQGAGATRTLRLTLARELTAAFTINLTARAKRAAPDAPLAFALPAPAPDGVRQCAGRVVLAVAESLRAQVEKQEQLQPMPLDQALQSVGAAPPEFRQLLPTMAFEYRGLDLTRPAGAQFTLAVKPTQVSAVVHRRVNIQPGSVEHEAVLDFQVLYAPVDTFYIQLPAALADAGVQIEGQDLKEKPRLAALPADQLPAAPAAPPGTPPAAPPAGNWAFHKIVLQSPVIGHYWLTVKWRQSFQATADGAETKVTVEPVFAAGKLSDQNGYVAVVKAPTLAIGTETAKNLTPGDAGSAEDLPYAPHRAGAIKAYRYPAPPYELVLPVRLQQDAAVFTAIANAVVIEQAVARDGTLNGRAIYFLSTSRGDRLEITLPPAAQAYAFLLDGQEVTVEDRAPNVKLVRLPPSAGQVGKVTVEVSYGLKQGAWRRLPAPQLPATVPVQRTFWRLWAPADYRLLGHDRNFSLVTAGAHASVEDLCQAAAPGHRYSGAARFATSGSAWLFERQGAASVLSVWLMGREWFAIVLWALVLLAGVILLRHDGYRRVQVLLAVALVVAGAQLFRPLLVAGVIEVCRLPVILVAVLWLATAFVRERRRRRAAAARGEG